MSRIGKKPVPVVQGVTVSVSPSAAVVKGPKGTLEVPIPRGITCRVDDGRVLRIVETVTEDRVVGPGRNRSFSEFLLVPIGLFIFYPQYLFFWKAKNASKSIKLYLALFLPSFFRFDPVPVFQDDGICGGNCGKAEEKQ